MTVTDHADAARTDAAGVRLCARCGRPVTARDKNEYTAARARVVADKGLCVCRADAPTRGPSLI
jgi:hypothetical protein